LIPESPARETPWGKRRLPGHKKMVLEKCSKNLNTFGFLAPSVSAPSGCDTAWTGTYISITAKRRGGKGEQALYPSWLYLCFSFYKEKELEKEFSTLKKYLFHLSFVLFRHY